MRGAGRGFRRGGFGGISVDALAKEAGLTSGAFYTHFSSKAEAFCEALTDELVLLRRGVLLHQEAHGAAWLGPFVDFYLGERLQVELEDACALPTLTADASRADEQTRSAYGAELQRLVDAVAAGLPGKDREARAWTLLALLSGAAGMARAVGDEAQREAIVAAALKATRAAGFIATRSS